MVNTNNIIQIAPTIYIEKSHLFHGLFLLNNLAKYAEEVKKTIRQNAFYQMVFCKSFTFVYFARDYGNPAEKYPAGF